ncbi:MAG: hypothetical protein ACLPJH_03905 [Myxococcaceae bacterium]
MDVTEMEGLLKVLFPGAVMLMLVGGFVFRLTVKPTIDAISRLREGLRADQDTTLRRLAQLEDEVSRLRAGQTPAPPALEATSWPMRRDRD